MVGFGDMMKKAQALQTRMADIDEKLKTLEVTGTAGGGFVKVTLSGKGEALSVQIDPSLCKAEEKEVLEDLIVAAISDARQKMEALSQKEMSEAMGGLSLPPGMKIPGF